MFCCFDFLAELNLYNFLQVIRQRFSLEEH